jgi:hypothetical protein
MPWTLIVHNKNNFSVPLAETGTSWEVPAWGNHFYAFKMLTDDTLMMTWRLEATQVFGAPTELRLALPGEYETDFAGGQQWAPMFYNNNWQPGVPTPMEAGIAHTAEMPEGQTWVALVRGTAPLDINPMRWSSTKQIKRPGVGYLGGTYLFGTIIVAVRARS